MSAQIHPAPVRRAVRVKAKPPRAFAIFTDGIGRWWPAGHSVNPATTQANVTIEPRAGGRWFETGVDGSTSDWGRVAVWDPPGRLILIWQLDADFRYRPDFETEIEVTFTEEGDRTLVVLEHRLLERYGDRAEATARSLGSEGGWTALIAAFAARVDSAD